MRPQKLAVLKFQDLLGFKCEEKTGILLVIFYAGEGSRGQSLSPIQNTQAACPRLLTRIIIFTLRNDGNSLGRDLASQRPASSSLIS